MVRSYKLQGIVGVYVFDPNYNTFYTNLQTKLNLITLLLRIYLVINYYMILITWIRDNSIPYFTISYKLTNLIKNLRTVMIIIELYLILSSKEFIRNSISKFVISMQDSLTLLLIIPPSNTFKGADYDKFRNDPNSKLDLFKCRFQKQNSFLEQCNLLIYQGEFYVKTINLYMLKIK